VAREQLVGWASARPAVQAEPAAGGATRFSGAPDNALARIGASVTLPDCDPPLLGGIQRINGHASIMQSMIISEVDPSFWTAVPTVLWVFLICVFLSINHRHIDGFLGAISARLRAGASLKLGGLELSAIPEVPHVALPESEHSSSYQAPQPLRDERKRVYADVRGVMIVHRLFRSTQEGQAYDVLLYAIPHKGATLLGVDHIDYYLGHMWSEQVFTSTDRGAGFAIRTSAYGPFMVCATIHFTDGNKAQSSRYVDFEMGHYAPRLGNDK